MLDYDGTAKEKVDVAVSGALISHEVIINLIANTTARQRLKIKARLDSRVYPTRMKVTDEQLAAVRLRPATFHGEWNYCVRPAREK